MDGTNASNNTEENTGSYEDRLGPVYVLGTFLKAENLKAIVT